MELHTIVDNLMQTQMQRMGSIHILCIKVHSHYACLCIFVCNLMQTQRMGSMPNAKNGFYSQMQRMGSIPNAKNGFYSQTQWMGSITKCKEWVLYPNAKNGFYTKCKEYVL